MTSGHSWWQQLRNLFDANKFNGSTSAKGVDAQICSDVVRCGQMYDVSNVSVGSWCFVMVVMETCHSNVKSVKLPLVRQLMRQ